MKKFKQKLSKIHPNLFSKIIFVTVLGIVISVGATLFISLERAEEIYIEAFSTSNKKIINQITQDISKFNLQAYNIINVYSKNKYLKEFFLNDYENQVEIANITYPLYKELAEIKKSVIFQTFNVVAIGKNKRIVTDNKYGLEISADEFYATDIYNKYKKQSDIIKYSFTDNGFIGNSINSNAIIISRELKDIVNSLVFGDIFISIAETDFKKVYSNFVTNGNDILVINSEGTIISSSIQDSIGDTRTDIMNISKELVGNEITYDVYTIKNKEYTFIANYIPNMDVYVTNMIDNDYILKKFSKYKYDIGLISVFIIFIIAIVIFIITNRITSPLTNLIKTISSAKKENFENLAPVEGSYEVRQLSESYNMMINELDEHVSKLINEQEQRRLAELSALQMQIAPHFMYNTLTSIKYLAWEGDKEAVNTMINSFIALLQNTIGKTDEFVTVKDQIENLNHYVAINSLRYGDAIKVSYYINDNTLNIKIPKLLLQPIVENSFFHAFEKKQNGNIKIFTSIVKEYLLCEVVDNGDGIAEGEKILKPSKKKYSTGIGLNNIEQRLNIIYDGQAKIEIESHLGIGTSVMLYIPIDMVKSD